LSAGDALCCARNCGNCLNCKERIEGTGRFRVSVSDVSVTGPPEEIAAISGLSSGRNTKRRAYLNSGWLLFARRLLLTRFNQRKKRKIQTSCDPCAFSERLLPKILSKTAAGQLVRGVSQPQSAR
jgi:hypothetical protein